MSPTTRHGNQFTRPGPPMDEYAEPRPLQDDSSAPRVLRGLWMAVCFILAFCVLLVIAEMLGA